MNERSVRQTPTRARVGILALLGAAILTLGFPTGARASSSLMADATKQGNDGHPYHWAAPC